MTDYVSLRYSCCFIVSLIGKGVTTRRIWIPVARVSESVLICNDITLARKQKEFVLFFTLSHKTNSHTKWDAFETIDKQSDNQLSLLGPSSDHQRPDRSDIELKRNRKAKLDDFTLFQISLQAFHVSR